MYILRNIYNRKFKKNLLFSVLFEFRYIIKIIEFIKNDLLKATILLRVIRLQTLLLLHFYIIYFITCNNFTPLFHFFPLVFINHLPYMAQINKFIRVEFQHFGIN